MESPLWAAAQRFNHTVTILPNGNVLTVGGQTDNTTFLNTAEIFISSTGQTVATEPMDVARASHTATLLPNGLVLVVGGASGNGVGNFLSSGRLYDYRTGQWSNAGALGTARTGHTATLLADGRVLAAGGLSAANSTLSSTELYDPTGNSWSAGASMNQGRAHHTATLLYNGEILMAGGVSTGSYLASAEIFNMNSGFRIAQPLNIGRALHSAVALADRTVLVTGGYNPAYTTGLSLGYLDSVEIFDPVTESWTLKTAMKERRRLHTSTLYPDGRVSVLGGMGNIPRLLTSGSANTSGGAIGFTGCNANTESPISAGSYLSITNLKLNFPNPYNGLVLEGTVAIEGRITHSTGTIKIDSSLATIKNSEIVDGTLAISSIPLTGITGTVTPLTCPTVSQIVEGWDRLSFVISGATVTVSTMVFADNEIYTKSADSWSFGVKMSTQRVSHSSILLPGGEQYVLYGSDGIDANPIGRTLYIPVEGSWSNAASMSTARSYFTSTLLSDGRVLAAGGSSALDPSIVRNSAEIYNPVSNLWQNTGSMNFPRTHHTATLLPNGRVLVAGGFSTINGSTEPVSSAEIYFPDSGVWRRVGNMSDARSNHSATLLPDGNVLVAGGYRAGVYLNTAEIFISTAGVWAPLSTMPSGRSLHSATLLSDGRVLLAGGFNGAAMNSTSFYNPGGGFSAGPNLNAARHSHSATLLEGNQVLAAGGNNGSGEFLANNVEVYNPVTNAWSAFSDTFMRRYSHTATLLPTGHVFVSGGLNSDSGYLSSAGYFHPEISSWTALASMASKRAYHSAALLSDGKVISIGGFNGSSDLSAAELAYHTPYVPEESRRPSFSAVSSTITVARGAQLSAQGSNFTSQNIEANSGLGNQNASSLHPKPQLSAVSFPYLADLSTMVFASPNSWSLISSSVSFQVPASTGFPYGWYHLRIISDAAASQSRIIQVAPPVPTQAPSLLAGVTAGTSTINWSWTAPAGTFDGYNVYSATNNVWVGTATTTAFSHTGLSPNTPASIKVAAFTLSGDGPTAVSSTVYTLANAPSGLTLSTVTFQSAFLSWNTNGNAAGTPYEVSMSTDNFTLNFSSPASFASAHTASTISITGLAGNTTYWFRVRAINGGGALTAFTSTISTQTPISSPIQGLAAAGATPTSILWSWTAVPGIINYRVYQSSSGLIIGSPATNGFTQTNLSTNTAYGVQVSAVSSLGEGPLSSAVIGYTSAANPAPISITPGETSITAQWGTNGNPAGTPYYVQLSTDNFSSVSASSFTLAMGSATLSGLSSNAQYSLRIAAINQAGTQTGFQNFGSAYTLAAIPAQLQTAGVSASKVTLQWSAGSNPAGTPYQVTVSTDNFTLSASTPVPFSSNFTGTTTTISSLFTSTTYYFRVTARNSAGTVTGFASTQTLTANGFAGAPSGSLALELTAGSAGSASAVLPSGRSVSVSVPAGSFTQELTMTVSEASSFNCGSINAGINVLTSISAQPKIPVTLSVSYAPGEITGNAETLVLSRYDTATGKCVPLESRVDTTARTITALTNHFSTFQIAQQAPSSSIGTVRVFPNPFYPSRGNGYVTLDQLPAGTRIRIFTIHGELVTEGFTSASGIFAWRGINSSGQNVASGIYLVLLEKDGVKKTVKIAVER